MSIVLSGDPFGPSFMELIELDKLHPTSGFIFHFDKYRQRLHLLNCAKGTTAHQITRWRSRLRHAYLLAINSVHIDTKQTLVTQIDTLRQSNNPHAVLTFTFDIVHNNETASGIPLLYFHQLRDIRCDLATIKSVVDKPTPSTNSLLPTQYMKPKWIIEPLPGHVTHRKLKLREDWEHWQKAEWAQLDSYDTQGMFGDPCKPPIDVAIFYWVWI
mmetsp:Transcript_27281/g.38576  ORF Transcript_27281/g.38576 Transcript_27281/m.38576 type:complete len:214 (-) Transcript_27281:315-956(-)